MGINQHALGRSEGEALSCLPKLKDSFAHVNASKRFNHPEADTIGEVLPLIRGFEAENVTDKYDGIEAKPFLWRLAIRDALGRDTRRCGWPRDYRRQDPKCRNHPSHRQSRVRLTSRRSAASWPPGCPVDPTHAHARPDRQLQRLVRPRPECDEEPPLNSRPAAARGLQPSRAADALPRMSNG